MVHLKGDTVTVFLTPDRAREHAQALEAQGKPHTKARVVPVTLHEAAGGATYGHAVRFKEPHGVWQFA